jgi:hypothetical protein
VHRRIEGWQLLLSNLECPPFDLPAAREYCRGKSQKKSLLGRVGGYLSISTSEAGAVSVTKAQQGLKCMGDRPITSYGPGGEG